MLATLRNITDRAIEKILPHTEVRAEFCGEECPGRAPLRVRYEWGPMGAPIRLDCKCS
jgi:hypothetical protein